MLKTEECEKEVLNTKRYYYCFIAFIHSFIPCFVVYRVHEEVSALKRKLDKYKHKEWSTMSDEVLVEEIKTYRVREDIHVRIHVAVGFGGGNQNIHYLLHVYCVEYNNSNVSY